MKTYTIGYYKLPSENYKVYVQDMSNYAYIENFTLDNNSNIVDVINTLKDKYPVHNVCEFIY